jgi:hypothetical protein
VIRRIIGLVAIVTAAIASAPQQRDVPNPAPVAGQPIGAASIAGAVVADADSRPLANAHVVLIGIGTGIVRITATDVEGQFTLPRLPADRYTLGASKPPFLGALAGAQRPARPGTPVVVADGQSVDGITIRLHRGATISGVLTDSKGNPAARVPVSVRRWGMQGGRRTMVASGVGTFATDDRGRYRIYGLLPGEYVVAAAGPIEPPARVLTESEVDAALRGEIGPPDPPATPVSPFRGQNPTYFPGTLRASDAISIHLAVGEERPNVNFQLRPIAPVRIDAQVVGADGQSPGTSASVSLRTFSDNIMQVTYTARTNADGKASFSNVAPDTYALYATGQAGGFAFATIDVSDTDVTGIVLALRPAPTIAGTLVFRGTTQAPPLAGRRVPLRELAAIAVDGLTSASISAPNGAGQFTISSQRPGRFVLGGPLAMGPTEGAITWTLESVVADGSDITDLPFEMGGDTIPKSIVVTYTDRFQELAGRISRENGTPVPDHTILVFPEDRRYWIYGSRRIVATRPDTDGRFTLSAPGPASLPPGRYLLAAVTDLDRDEQFDPAFLASIAPAAVPVTLGPGEKKVQNLVVR